mgnify:CR=1 FL=1
MKLIYQGKLYESVFSQETENKILNAIKSAKKYASNAENKLYRVGGSVRDELLGVESKDIDYLVTNVALDELKKALEPISDNIVSTNVGESMQVIKAVIDGSDEPYDFAIPRTEKYGGSGTHTDVIATGDPSIPVEEELGRRDLTINAIAYNVETHLLVDPFGGVHDIHNKLLKAVGNPNERFSEDPLRILRVLQFANRFGFDIEPSTMSAIKNNVALLDNITGERILEEFKKAFTKGNSKGNAKFIEMLIDTGIGTHVFGSGFDPVSVNIIYGDRWIVNMILLFINGGDFAKMKPSTDVSTAISLAKSLTKSDPLAVMFKNERYLPVIKDAFKSMGDETLINKLNSLEGVPLSTRDLSISSQFLMDNGYVGPRLGALQKNMINEIYLKHIRNDENDLKNYLDSLK